MMSWSSLIGSTGCWWVLRRTRASDIFFFNDASSTPATPCGSCMRLFCLARLRPHVLPCQNAVWVTGVAASVLKSVLPWHSCLYMLNILVVIWWFCCLLAFAMLCWCKLRRPDSMGLAQDLMSRGALFTPPFSCRSHAGCRVTCLFVDDKRLIAGALEALFPLRITTAETPDEPCFRPQW